MDGFFLLFGLFWVASIVVTGARLTYPPARSRSRPVLG